MVKLHTKLDLTTKTKIKINKKFNNWIKIIKSCFYSILIMELHHVLKIPINQFKKSSFYDLKQICNTATKINKVL